VPHFSKHFFVEFLSNFFGGGSDLGENSIFYLLRLLLILFHSFIEKKKKRY